MFTHAIARMPGNEFIQGLTSSAVLGAPDLALARTQHQAYVDALNACGLSVEVLAEEPGFPDAPFVEDTAVVVDEVAVVTRPGAASRAGEVRSIEPVLARYKPLAYIREPGTLDGGDVLQVGRQFYIGVSDRTNEEGALQLGSILARYGYNATLMPVGRGLHLKSSLNWVDGTTLLATPELARHEALRSFTVIEVPPEEDYAANCLRINGCLLVPRGFARVRAALELLPVQLIELDMSEFRKLDGGLTCLSLRFSQQGAPAAR